MGLPRESGKTRGEINEWVKELRVLCLSDVRCEDSVRSGRLK